MSVAETASPLAWSIDCNMVTPPAASPSRVVRSSGIVEKAIDGSGQPADPIPKGARIVRRWEAAQTDRLNEQHWADADGQPIDVDLAFYLPQLRARAAHEYHNNPMVEGVVTTHAIDVVGPQGPSLEVLSDDDRYATRLESMWRQWCEQCDIAGQMTLTDILQLWVRQQWTAGALLGQEVSDDSGSRFPALFRIHALHANRLATPWGMQSERWVAFGIRRNRYGRPLTYYITRPDYVGAFRVETGQFDPIPADMIYHGFVRSEPEQTVGYPLLASALPAIADLRDYDRSVLDAAIMAADRSEWFVNKNPDGEAFEILDEDGNPVSFEEPYKRRVTRAAPVGWDVTAHDAVHPTANYVEHRRERMAELGRAAAMPLMLIRLDSSQHNYSSSRFDHQGYIRHIESWQAWLGRTVLNRMVRTLARELTLAGELHTPKTLPRLQWAWQPPPDGDPVKSRSSERMGLQNRTLTFATACRKQNLQEDDVIASWSSTIKKLRAAGMKPEEIAAFLQITLRSSGASTGQGSRQPNDARPGNDPSNRPQTAAARP
ncbi:phage portal protein [Crateriforma conspicua]|uniref:Phage portal protein, lambda family n=1 Tax=Crateriforma conspicua TaxID=2527996 RepID=A0A5C6FZP8_9PLAN|nr:phage portal protein [Crateriforma conspicua]TWU66463.1 Phage portal protein, lambda family [Crateriforma conspicua]